MHKAIIPTFLKIIAIVAVFVLSVGLFFCSYPPETFTPADAVGSTPEGIQQVIEANNQFAFDFYSVLSQGEQGNVFFSPYSIFSGLAMVYEGAKGKTADEMKGVLNIPQSSELRPNLAAVYNEIYKRKKAYELNIAIALWVQQDFPLLEDYVNAIEKYYRGKAENLDFVKETEKSRQTINKFIEDQTNNKIKNLISPGVMDSRTRLLLTNAIYFKGTWKKKFDKDDTKEMDFRITANNIVKVPMMSLNPDKLKLNYADITDLKMIELPYKGEKVSMLVILPKDDLISLGFITEDKLNLWKAQMKKTKLYSVLFPKFNYKTKYILNPSLTQIGLHTAFSGHADFSGMTEKEQLPISTAIHQAYIKVDEEGTEASASFSFFGISSAGPFFKADHPFIFIIQEKQTGIILFFGRVVDPRS